MGKGKETNTLSDRQRQRQTLNICTESEGKKTVSQTVSETESVTDGRRE